jgi:hypothetical protein
VRIENGQPFRPFLADKIVNSFSSEVAADGLAVQPQVTTDLRDRHTSLECLVDLSVPGPGLDCQWSFLARWIRGSRGRVFDGAGLFMQVRAVTADGSLDRPGQVMEQLPPISDCTARGAPPAALGIATGPVPADHLNTRMGV